MFIAEVVAVFVDFILGEFGLFEVGMVVVGVEVGVHDVESMRDELGHLSEVVVEVLVEMESGLSFVFAGGSDLVDGVANAFEVVDDAEHCTDALGALVREVAFGNASQELGDFHLHAVGDFLIFLDALESAVEFIVVFGSAEGRQEGVHAKDTFGEFGDFAFGGLHVDFGGVHPAADIFEFVGVLLVLGFVFDQPVDDADNDGDEPCEDEGVEDVEEGMEEGECHGDGVGVVACGADSSVGVAADHSAGDVGDERHEGTEDDEGDDDTDNVEDQVGASGAFTVGVGDHGSDVGRDGGADVLSHDESDGGIESYPSVITHNEGDGHHGSGGLDKAGEESSYSNEEDDGPEAIAGKAGEGFEGLRVFFEVGHGLLEETHAEQEQGKTDDEFANEAEFVAFGEHEDERDGTEEHGEAEGTAALAQAKEGDNPCSDGCTDVGTHDDGDGTGQREEAGVDKGDNHDGCGRRGLDDSGDCCAGEDAAQGVAGNFSHDGAHAIAGNFLEAFTHKFHAEEEHGKCPGKIDDDNQNFGE